LNGGGKREKRKGTKTSPCRKKEGFVGNGNKLEEDDDEELDRPNPGKGLRRAATLKSE